MEMSGPETTIHTHKVVITDAYMIAYEDDYERIENNVFYAEFFAPYLPPGVEPMEPASDIYYPIFEDSHKGIKLTENDDREAVGVFCLSVYWRDTVKKILPAAVQEYVEIMKRESSVTLKPKVVLSEDKASNLPESSFGGVLLTALNGKIVCDNTMSSRLNLVYEELLPSIRAILFPESQ